MIELLPMRECHVKSVAQLESRCFSLPWSESAIAGELQNPLSLWLVAVADGFVAGYIGSQSVMDEADMMNLAIDPAFRKRGIAEQLVKELIGSLRDRNVSKLTLEVRASNIPAITLYQKMGFEQVGKRPGYYQKPKEDALIYRKEWEV